MVKCEIFRDHFQNARQYNLRPADLLIADVPYCIGQNFNASRPSWWEGGRVENGESRKAGKAAFNSDYSFSIPDFFAFAPRLLKKNPGKGEKGAPCMIIFAAFEQLGEIIQEGEKHGFKHHIPLVFVKPSSPQVLKANMKIVGACEYALVLYRDKLPKFNNIDPSDGKKHMIKNWFEFVRDGKEIPRIHPTQKPVNLLKRLISIFTDPGDVVIDPCCGSGSTLRAARELGRNSYGFEIDREFYARAREDMLSLPGLKTDAGAAVSQDNRTATE